MTPKWAPERAKTAPKNDAEIVPKQYTKSHENGAQNEARNGA